MNDAYTVGRIKPGRAAQNTGAWFRDAFKNLQDLFLPVTCAFCGSFKEVDRDSLLCRDCLEKHSGVAEPVCAVCGRPLVGTANPKNPMCGRCMTAKKPSHLERTRFATYDAGALGEAIRAFKYRGALFMRRPLSHILRRAFARYFQMDNFDVVIGVPIHNKKLATRGYNQSVLLAKALSDCSGKPLDKTLLLKTKDTPAQVGLHKPKRIRNLEGAFKVKKGAEVEGRKILVVDDVLTTGATLAEVAKTLKKAGAARVEGLVLALRDGPGLRGSGYDPSTNTPTLFKE